MRSALCSHLSSNLGAVLIVFLIFIIAQIIHVFEIEDDTPDQVYN